MSFDLVIAGVGGQPIDRMVELFAAACDAAGVDFQSTAPRGVLLLGGSRLAQVSVGECWSSIVTEDTGGLLIALEVGEALRYAKYCSRDGIALVDSLVVPPEARGDPRPYPTAEALELAMREVITVVHTADFRAFAKKASGEADLAYAFLVGAASRVRGLDAISGAWNDGLKKAGATDGESKAFAAGAQWAPEKKGPD